MNVNLVCRSYFHLLHRLRQVRGQHGQDFTVRLVVALILSRLDSSNSLYAGLQRPQLLCCRVQNAAARLVFGLGSRDHITPAMIQLRWRPVHQRVTYKLCVVMYGAQCGFLPSYLTGQLNSCCNSSRRSGQLRSADITLNALRRLRTKFGERAFSYAGPCSCNALLSSIR
jgi:hypothetical protein